MLLPALLLPALEPPILVADYLISATTISTTDKEAALIFLNFLRFVRAGFSMKKSVFALSFLAAATFGLCSTTYAANRDLVFEEDEETVTAPADSANETIAVKTTVQLTRNGETSNVLPDAEFQSGDRVKLLFTSNVDGYVYWLAKGTSGNYSVLFPNAKAGMSNEIKRNQEYTVPAKGSFRFDDTPGNEELLCIVSTTRIPEIEEAAGNNFQDPSAIDNATAKQEKRKSSNRDLVFEEEDEGSVNTVAQETPKGEPFVAFYTLKHN